MAKKKTGRSLYNDFFEKFKKKGGYIGSLLKNKAGQSVFEFHFDSKNDADEAKKYLSENAVKYTTSSTDPRRVIARP